MEAMDMKGSCCNFCAVKDKMRDNVKKSTNPKSWKGKSPDLEIAKVAFKNKKEA